MQSGFTKQCPHYNGVSAIECGLPVAVVCCCLGVCGWSWARLGCVGVVCPAGVSGASGSAARRLAEAPTLGSCESNTLGGIATTLKDHAVQTSVDIIGSGVDGYITYQIKLHLAADVESVYTIFGTEQRQMIFPPAYQCPAPFGVDVGGVNSAFFEVANSEATGFAQYDSWLTVGLTNGDGSNAMSSLGINFRSWDEDTELVSDAGTGGAVFWMDHHDAAASVSDLDGADRTVVIAQLTLPAAPGAATARFDTRAQLACAPSACLPRCAEPPQRAVMRRALPCQGG